MRQIKFRGKCRKTGKWFYGNLYVEDSHGRTHICTTERGCLDIDPDTVGQFTGLTDCNGKEIYEGDIIEDEIGLVYEICWYDDLASFMAEMMCNARPFMISDIGTKNINIIGNIHDNPELINK